VITSGWKDIAIVVGTNPTVDNTSSSNKNVISRYNANAGV
jgi:hypothetical protein